MEDFERKDFSKILKTAGLEAVRWMKQNNSNVCRVYDRNIGSLPLTVDLYGHYARIMDYSDEGFSAEEIEEISDIVSRYLYIEKAKVIYTERKKREGREQHEKGSEETKVEVLENGLKFECELSLYADTGLFLDQAETRKMVMEMSRNMRVLNLFCYTSSFSVYAAQGGAEQVVSVDLSNVYSAWSRRNLDNNGFLDEKKYEVVTGDARAYLEKAVADGAKFDIVVFDPPAFSNSHKAEDFDVQKDYVVFLSLINQLLPPEGVVVFSENLSGFRFEKRELERYFKVREITNDVHALNFSTKRKSCRVWVLEKVADMKTVMRRRAAAAPRSRRAEEDYKENMDENTTESLERLTLTEEAVAAEPKKTVREGKSSPRAFSFEDGEVKLNEEEGNERKERRDRDSFGGRRDRDDRRSGDRRSSYGRDRKDFGSRDRDDRRERRFSDDRRERRFDDRRDSFKKDGRRDFSSREERGSRFSEDRRPSRFSDERRDFSRREDRDGDRYSDRRESRFSREERPSRFSDDRRGDRRDSFKSDRFSGERRDRFSSDSRSFGGRRDNEGRRDNYKRDSFPGRDRRFHSEDRDWDNETGRMYRSERSDRNDRFSRDDRGFRGGRDRDSFREGRRDGERKKSSPKPFGYDSFLENKSREGATAFWMQSQIVTDEKN
ncbi:MAG: class I SAM-dependent methyltransferase [Spirochaetales bacterium]|nr:class I SAM-dependent methyltransferase [Candidatus Physcosoma equi]